MGMCVSERVELDELRERVCELERRLAALAVRQEAEDLRRTQEPADSRTLHLRDKPRGK